MATTNTSMATTGDAAAAVPMSKNNFDGEVIKKIRVRVCTCDNFT